MLPLVLAAALLAPSDPPASHEAANPLYKELREAGLAVGEGKTAKLPAPVVADGLDAAGQRKAIAAFVAGDQSWEEYTRGTVVAPQTIRIGKPLPSDPKAPARPIDTGFVVHGDFEATKDEKFLNKLLGSGREGGGGKPITADDLAKRKITPGEQEKIGYVEFDILDRVRLNATGQAVWSRTGDSVLAAARIDPRFRGDKEFPNEWRPLKKEDGKAKLGPPSPYEGAAFYLKITKLVEPKGAMFVEQHVIYAEPTGWFEGENLLRSKLTPVVQSNARAMRREWAARDNKK